jgi:hypothetical protein
LPLVETAPRWTYWINPGTSWVESFVQHFHSPDIYMWPEESDAPPSWFAWASPHLDDVRTQQEFVDRTASLKAVFDGAMFIAVGLRYHPPGLHDPRSDDPTDHAFVLGLPGDADVRVEPFSLGQIGKKIAAWRDPLEDPVARMIFLARYDAITRAILKFVGVQGLTYISLYAFRDWMKAAGWSDDRIAQEAGWSKAQLGDFTNTANNPAYLGPYARHGGVAQPPKRPMKLDDAEGPMRRAVGAFMLEQAAAVGLEARWNALKV